MADAQTVDVDGRRLRLSSLDKVLYPQDGFTKGDVLDYFARVAAALVPLAAGRPATRKRWPDGVGTPESPGKVFFVKNLEPHAPDWVVSGEIEHSGHANRYPVVDDTATLVWLAQLATLEVHVPQWRFGADGRPENPDRMVFDLDPGDGAGLAECAEAARLVRALLIGMGLDPLPVTSGSKGIHLYTALDGRSTSDRVTEIAHELARALEADHPDLVVSDMKKANRVGRVLLDWSQNRAAKTTLVPYSLRGTTTPRAAAPRTWAELDDPDLRQLTPGEVLQRLEADGDLLAALHGAAPTSAPARDRLTAYRGKRDAIRTPEPVPVEPPVTGRDDAFVIQEHHARRLHWDFRLEREGVLVSWALPRGVPELGGRNRLAVHTEDHPLEYGSFEGDIPAGEYGGGRVDVWDAGTYAAEKWCDGEVIATLQGRPAGGLGGAPVKLALIRTGQGRHRDTDEDAHAGEQWLIHRMALPEGEAGAAQPEAPQPAPEADPEPASAPPDAPAPMLAARIGPDGLDPHDDWALELKWDGFRAIAVVADGAVRLTSRNGQDLTPTYPELAALGTRVDGDAVLDGEIVAPDERGRPSFARLQQRSGLTRPADVERARKAVAVRYVLFDVLAHDGEDLTGRRYAERRALLERIVRPGGGVEVPEAIGTARGADAEHELAIALATSADLGLEGVVAKRLDGVYRAGRRSTDWLKQKNELQQEVVVAGWRPGSGAREGRIGSLLLGIPDGDGLRYVGRVGTGFTDASLDEIEHRLDPLARKTAPVSDVPAADARDAHWVAPELVGEVRFAEWTEAGRLRQPAWRGWRLDKSPEEVVREG